VTVFNNVPVSVQMRTLSGERIGKKIGRIPAEKISLIVEGLNEIIED
jgi:hypothetical protein